MSSSQYLRWRAYNGLAARMGKVQPEYAGQLEEQLSTIQKMGFSGYFLVLADIVAWAKEHGILVGPSRGSAGGSLVAYALGLTSLDPLKHGLMAERFLNPDRVSLPDIDIDFPQDRRDEVLDYVTEKYGSDCAVRVMTFGTIGAKAALKDAARVSGLSFKAGAELVAKLPEHVPDAELKLAEHLPKGLTGPVVDLARDLEGLVRQASQHASAVVISPEPLNDVLPLWHQVKSGVVGRVLTGFDAGPCEDLGLVKMDFLGLRTLTVVDTAMRAAGVDITAIPLDDRDTYAMLARGESLGVFQLDSSGMRELLQSVKPGRFADVAAVVALYRPGPMGAKAHLEYASRKRRGLTMPTVHPELDAVLEPLLRETYGLVVYQEQVMAVVREVAGFTLAQADILRKAMGKKQADVLASERPRFAAGMLERGFHAGAVDALWDVLTPFCDYAFNKSHACGYAMLAYWTAYLKAHHPREYMAALLTSVTGTPDKRLLYQAETERLGIGFLPPSVNLSEAEGGFVADLDNNAIRFGLTAIDGVGQKVAARVVDGAPYSSLHDFLNRSHGSVLNTKALRALVRAGALDTLANREGFDTQLDDLLEAVAARKERQKKGYRGRLAGDRADLEVAPLRTNPGLRQQWELETLGVSLTTVPITLRYTRPVSRRDLEWVRSLLLAHPGRSPVSVAWGDWVVDTGISTDLDNFSVAALKVAGVEVV